MKKLWIVLLLWGVVCLPAQAASNKSLFEEISQGQEEIAGLKRHTIKIDGQRIFYLDNEKSNAEQTILLIHGFGDRSLTWMQFSRRFRDAGFRIIVPDLLGFGKSDKPEQADYRFSAQSARLFELMKKLNVEKLHVVGNSMGGGIAAQMALDAPEKIASLTLMDAAGIHYKPTDMDRALLNGRNMLVIKTPQDFRDVMAMVAYKSVPAPRPVVDYLAEQAVENSALHERILRDALFEDLNFLMLEMEKITTPTLIVWGEKDRLLHPDNAKVLHHFIKNSKLEIMPDIGHVPQMEAPFESSEIVLNFIQGLKK
jgi:pimeloyl-ACP methyl ester carboxylesterase